MILIQNIKMAGIMNINPVTLREKDNVGKVRDVFSKKNIHHIPVVDSENKVKGIVSTTDYAVALDPLTPFGNDQTVRENEKTFKALLVEDIMAKNVVTLKPEENISKALHIFKENLFHAIPVVDDDKKLLGIVTTYDLLMLIQ